MRGGAGSPRRSTRRRFLKWAAGLAAAGAGLTVWDTFRVRVDRVEVWLPRLPSGWDGAQVVFLSDLHRGPLVPAAYLARCVEMARALPHDIAMLGGDYVSVSSAFAADVAKALAGWAPPLGIYGVLGNHDYWTDPVDVGQALSAAGVTVLGNENRILERGGDALRLVALDDPMTNHDDLARALEGTSPEEFRFVLAHAPELAWELSVAKVDFALSGHTHGGQICLPGGEPIVVPCSPGKALAKGLRQNRGVWHYVSRGIGVTTAPLRTFCPPEITHLTLRKGERP